MRWNCSPAAAESLESGVWGIHFLVQLHGRTDGRTDGRSVCEAFDGLGMGAYSLETPLSLSPSFSPVSFSPWPGNFKRYINPGIAERDTGQFLASDFGRNETI